MAVIEFEEGWEKIRETLAKLTRKGVSVMWKPNIEEEMNIYSTIYYMCNQEPPHNYAERIYHRINAFLEEYMHTVVLPSLREKNSEFMLREFTNISMNYKAMMNMIAYLFYYLDWFFTARQKLPAIKEVGLNCFYQLVYQEINSKLKDAAIILINQDREGAQIDKPLLKNTLDIFKEFSSQGIDLYHKEFETAILEESMAYYSRKASNWVLENSYDDYILKVNESLKQEKVRVSHYLHLSSQEKLLEKVNYKLLYIYASHIFETEEASKVENLSKLYNRLSEVPHRVNPIIEMFKQTYVKNMSELQKKYLGYVNDCFNQDPRFYEASMEADFAFYQGTVAQSSRSFDEAFPESSNDGSRRKLQCRRGR